MSHDLSIKCFIFYIAVFFTLLILLYNTHDELQSICLILTINNNLQRLNVEVFVAALKRDFIEEDVKLLTTKFVTSGLIVINKCEY